MKQISFEAVSLLIEQGEYDQSITELLKIKKALLENAKEANVSQVKQKFVKQATQVDQLIEKVRIKKDTENEIETEEMDKPIQTGKVVHFSDVIGLSDVKNALRNRIIYPFEYPEIFEAFDKKAGGGVLLYGPPGTGKTLVVRALANEIGADFYPMKCSDLLSKYFGESEANIKKLFADANKSKRAVIFFDELDALASKRGDETGPMNRVVAELLTSIDGFSGSNPNVLIVGATNMPWLLDDALVRPPRFSEMIYVSIPDFDARIDLFKLYLKNVQTEELDYDLLAALTEGHSAADITEIVEMSKNYPIQRAIKEAKIGSLKMDDLEVAISNSRKSVTDEMLDTYETFNER